jgi:hypothetical protein
VLLSLVVGEDVDVDCFSIFFCLEKNGKEFFCQSNFFWYHEKMSHDQQPSLIWFQLVDSDGQPYKGSSASSLSLNPSAVVDELRQAAVNKNPNMLTLVDAAQLKVYIKTRLLSLEKKRLWKMTVSFLA